MSEDNIFKKAQQANDDFCNGIVNYLDMMLEYAGREILEINKFQEEKYNKEIILLFNDLDKFHRQNIIDKYLDDREFGKLKLFLDFQ